MFSKTILVKPKAESYREESKRSSATSSALPAHDSDASSDLGQISESRAGDPPLSPVSAAVTVKSDSDHDFSQSSEASDENSDMFVAVQRPEPVTRSLADDDAGDKRVWVASSTPAASKKFIWPDKEKEDSDDDEEDVAAEKTKQAKAKSIPIAGVAQHFRLFANLKPDRVVLAQRDAFLSTLTTSRRPTDVLLDKIFEFLGPIGPQYFDLDYDAKKSEQDRTLLAKCELLTQTLVLRKEDPSTNDQLKAHLVKGIHEGLVYTVMYLASRNLDLNARYVPRPYGHEQCPLFIALDRGDFREGMVRLLCEQGASVNPPLGEKNALDAHPLGYALDKADNCRNTVLYLLWKGAKFTITAEKGITTTNAYQINDYYLRLRAAGWNLMRLYQNLLISADAEELRETQNVVARIKSDVSRSIWLKDRKCSYSERAYIRDYDEFLRIADLVTKMGGWRNLDPRELEVRVIQSFVGDKTWFGCCLWQPANTNRLCRQLIDVLRDMPERSQRAEHIDKLQSSRGSPERPIPEDFEPVLNAVAWVQRCEELDDYFKAETARAAARPSAAPAPSS